MKIFLVGILIVFGFAFAKPCAQNDFCASDEVTYRSNKTEKRINKKDYKFFKDFEFTEEQQQEFKNIKEKYADSLKEKKEKLKEYAVIKEKAIESYVIDEVSLKKANKGILAMQAELLNLHTVMETEKRKILTEKQFIKMQEKFREYKEKEKKSIKNYFLKNKNKNDFKQIMPRV